jgi:nucleoside 2-deoxyribosyltransferase
MKLFIAGKVGKEEEARKVMEMVREAGHEITFDWTSIPHLRPYEKNEEMSKNAAILEAQAASKCDALILLADEKGVGMYVELGIALANGKPVFVIGGEGIPTMFLFHPLVQRVKTVREALSLLKTLNKAQTSWAKSSQK